MSFARAGNSVRVFVLDAEFVYGTVLDAKLARAVRPSDLLYPTRLPQPGTLFSVSPFGRAYNRSKRFAGARNATRLTVVIRRPTRSGQTRSDETSLNRHWNAVRIPFVFTHIGQIASLSGKPVASTSDRWAPSFIVNRKKINKKPITVSDRRSYLSRRSIRNYNEK